MRRLLFALITAALSAQEPAREAKFQVSGSELRYLYAAGADTPLLIILPGSMDEAAVRKLFSQWQPAAASLGWNCAMPFVAGVADGAVRAIELVAADVRKRLPNVDETRIYLAGIGASTPEVFYTLSRTPDIWAAAL